MVAILTKREYITNLYQNFIKKIDEYHITDVSKIFPPVEELDLPELILTFSYYFANSELYEQNVKMLINIHSIVIPDEKFPEVFAIIKTFLVQFSKVC